MLLKETAIAPDAPLQVKPERLTRLMFGFAPPLILEAALQHHVFDVLQDAPKSVEQVSQETGASVRGLRAVMNALVALEFLTKDETQKYSLTPESSTFLVSTKPSFLGGLLHQTTQQLLPQWMKLTEVVQTGEPAKSVNQEKMGATFFERFVDALFPANYPAARVLAKILNLAQTQQPTSVLDLGTGSGVWGIALAQASPLVQVTAIDWAQVLPITQRIATRNGVADRFKYVPGDYLNVDFGDGYQVAVLGQILHTEGESRSHHLLTKVFEALAPGGTIVIAEWLPDSDRRGPLNALIFAVNMLVLSDEGNTFSADEIGGWLREVGFGNIQTVAVPAPFPLILATKPH
jgi:SAM-dependent methyltransferase